MKIQRSLCIVCCAVLVAFATRAEGGGWFSNKDKRETHATQTVKSSGDAIPIVSSISTGTKKLVTGTASFFKPKKTEQPQPGFTAHYTPAKKNKKDERGFFERLFFPEPPPPRTVGEWMELEQIHP